jgi:D-alanyl-D-alanine carboxypeptidase (penicillin-binding protein 5/6)
MVILSGAMLSEEIKMLKDTLSRVQNYLSSENRPSRGVRPVSGKLFSFVLILSLLISTGCGVKEDVILSSQDESFEKASAAGTFDTMYAADLLYDGAAADAENNMNATTTAVNCDSAILVNDTDSQTVYSKNAFKKEYPASTTKIMTVLLCLESCSLEDTVTISYNAANISDPTARKCGFHEGARVKLEDLLYAMLLYSGNDAAIAVGEYTAGGDYAKFINMMNKKAADLGCVCTHFVNTNGLHDPLHYSCAYDMYLIMRQCVKYKKFVKIIHTQRHDFEYKDADDNTHNMAVINTCSYIRHGLAAPGGVRVYGGKTGTTSDAGSCLVLYSKSASGKKYISVVLKASGAVSLYNSMDFLLSQES